MVIVIAVISVFGIALAALLLRGSRGASSTRIAVALTLGSAALGYALTGDPTLPAAPVVETHFDRDSHSAFETARVGRLERFGEVGAWLTFTDAMIREGATATAVRGLQGIIADYPDNPDLWIGLGNALAMHGDGVGAASRLAFGRAAALAPTSPQPVFFLGLARLETGDARGAARTWRTLPPTADLDRWVAEADMRAVGQPG